VATKRHQDLLTIFERDRIGEGGTSEQRRVDARLREAAGLMRICRRVGKGPPAADGRRRPFALVN
jgi:hypothetical protein